MSYSKLWSLNWGENFPSLVVGLTGQCSVPEYETSDTTAMNEIQQSWLWFTRLLVNYFSIAKMNWIQANRPRYSTCHYNSVMQVPKISLIILRLSWISETYWMNIYYHPLLHISIKFLTEWDENLFCQMIAGNYSHVQRT